MKQEKQTGLGDDELFGTPMAEAKGAGPSKGEFVAPPDVPDVDEPQDALPEQEEFWRAPVRFGSIPVEANPLGWDRRRGFRKLYPQVMLPTQVVERISFGHPDLEPNRLFWGDNLHVMRQLTSESIDLIYIDPPFFSGQEYNVLFGDQNELRSFVDIWEGGLPGYLIWLNARLYEMKRLLRPTGSLVVHVDWHAAHYVKVELDKLFGHERFQNELIWFYKGGGSSTSRWSRKHDNLFWYTKSNSWTFNLDEVRTSYSPEILSRPKSSYRHHHYGNKDDPTGVVDGWDLNPKGKRPDDVLEIPIVNPGARERIGYPTQKPEDLLTRLVIGLSNPGDAVADFVVGGGTTPAVAQRLGRHWIACDQSRVAVAITADRLSQVAEQLSLDTAAKSFAVPDFTVEH